MAKGEGMERRDFLKYLGVAIGDLVVGGAAGYLSRAPEIVKEVVTTTVERTKTVTVTAPPRRLRQRRSSGLNIQS